MDHSSSVKARFYCTAVPPAVKALLILLRPLDLLVSQCRAIPEQVANAAGDLVHYGGLIAGLGFEGVRSDSKCWMYFPENNSPFYRVTNFHNYSRFNVPDGDIKKYFSLMCESTYSSYIPVNKTTIIQSTLDGLVGSVIIDEEQKQQVARHYLIDISYSYHSFMQGVELVDMLLSGKPERTMNGLAG